MESAGIPFAEQSLYRIYEKAAFCTVQTMVRYALVEWDEDRSRSVVPLSRLLSRKGARVTQKWGARVYAGKILEEGGEYVNVQP